MTEDSIPKVTEVAINEIAKDMGKQALDLLDRVFLSDGFQERLRTMMSPILAILIEDALKQDGEMRSKMNEFIKPMMSHYNNLLLVGGSVAGIVVLLMLIMLLMISSVRFRST